MPSKIKILSVPVINRIAAGEIIERPSSIVKELIDNSIDAQSSEIIVRLKEGGRSFISISDNGEGMTPEDALLAFERHATSKLSSEEDLESIKTLGFRGEALPSIAAVSRVYLSTQAKSEPGVELELVDGKIINQAEIARAVGTGITITDLFENYPVRKKFLRSASTELANIVSILNQLALVNYRISFELIHHDKKIFKYPAVESLRDRVFQIYGRETLDTLVPLKKGDDPDFEVEGFVSLPPHTHGSRSAQEIFVNRRPIKNPMINHAVYEAYSSHLMKGQHPAYFLLIRVEPARVDVNVHPSKKEVRFTDSSGTHQRVYRTVKESLNSTGWDLRGETSGSRAVLDGYGEVGDQTNPENPVKERLIFSDSEEKGGFHDRPDLFGQDPSLKEASFKVLGQFRSMFILVQTGDSLRIIDQHAAHERVLFEKFLTRSQQAKVEPQPLLIPQTFEMNIKEILILREYEKSFLDIGIEIDFFGENTVLIRALPDFLSPSGAQSLIADLVEEIKLFQGFSSEKELRGSLIATLACHAAVKAGQSLEHSEISALFQDLCVLGHPLTCPHGRPITLNFSVTDLEKMFCRI